MVDGSCSTPTRESPRMKVLVQVDKGMDFGWDW